MHVGLTDLQIGLCFSRPDPSLRGLHILFALTVCQSCLLLISCMNAQMMRTQQTTRPEVQLTAMQPETVLCWAASSERSVWISVMGSFESEWCAGSSVMAVLYHKKAFAV